MNKNNLKSILKVFVLNVVLGILSIPGVFLSMWAFEVSNTEYFETIYFLLIGEFLNSEFLNSDGLIATSVITASIFIVLIINYFAIKKRKNREISHIILTIIMILGVFTPIILYFIYLDM